MQLKKLYHEKDRNLIDPLLERKHMKVKDHTFFGMLQETNFANVDLDIYSRSPLQPLVAAFGKKVTIHYEKVNHQI